MNYQTNKLEFIKIPGSSFLMGSTDVEIERTVQFWKNKLVDSKFTEEKFRSWIQKEYPVFTIDISPFQLSKYPITNGIYRIFCLKAAYPLSPSLVQEFPEDHPVWGVTPEDIKNFTDFYSKLQG
ncbi:MAG: SUMF1/EgtB/PvdO family nonheme iron enzyme [Pleurocapsa sp. CRU_1_2]|nr:SUMF1/EgtB/PvdO family nonheme iron enzyme [Pleurocapsa sp. CRU_1_2]